MRGIPSPPCQSPPMSALRMFALGLAMLATGSAGASDRVSMRVSLVLVEACTVDAREHASPDAVRVTCTSTRPYRVDRGTSSGTGVAAHPSGGAAVPVTTVVF